MAQILIANGHVVDPSQSIDRVMNVLIEGRKIVELDAANREAGEGVEVIDASGLRVVPGLVDLYCELREPGFEEDETIVTGTAAALAGGFTSIAVMPNTDPPVDTQAQVQFVRQKAARARNCRVYVIACVSKNRDGNELAEIGTLVEAGAVAFSDGGRPIRNTELLRRALEYCSMFDKPIFNRPDVGELSHGGIMHEGLTSTVLGLPGIPAEAEDVMTGRDLRVAEATGGRLHLVNLSSSGSIDLVRRAKSRGVGVTAQVAAAHLVWTDERLRSFDSNYKVSPPLRSQDHIEACIEGLRDGTIDVICSGHTPRSLEKKMRELDLAPFGIMGLETTLSLVIQYLIEPGHLSWSEAIARLSTHPAHVLGVPKGTLEVGADADVVLIDPSQAWTASPDQFHSKSCNTPLCNSQLKGRAVQVLVEGEVRLKRE